MTTTKNKPSKPDLTLRDGGIKADLWVNAGEKRATHSVRISRTWRDEQGVYHDSDRFSGSELLRVALLATRAYEHLATLKRADDHAEGGS